jgi:thiol-disulfide isomerase/thioredoxin
VNTRNPSLSTESEPGRRTFLIGAASAALLLTGCAAQDPLAAQAKAGDNKNYIAGDGSVSEYAPGNRGEPVQLGGQLYDGTSIDSADWSDKVVVLNFWYASCAPCRVEAPDLEALHQDFKDQDVLFYGVNVPRRCPRHAKAPPDSTSGRGFLFVAGRGFEPLTSGL